MATTQNKAIIADLYMVDSQKLSSLYKNENEIS